MHWLFFALMTVATWGLYGIFLHKGQMLMGGADPVASRYKAFLFVGIAYFLIAVLAPLAMLKFTGASWNFESKGMWWSLIAGVVGAVGAFCVLLAFGGKGNPTPAVVMSIIFAGAPIVNAVVGILMHKNQIDGVKWQFVLGILLAAMGGMMVTMYKPNPKKKVAVSPLTGAQVEQIKESSNP